MFDFFSSAQRRLKALAAAGCLLLAVPGRAAFSVYNLTVGRLTERPGLWILANDLNYEANRYNNPAQDTMQAQSELHYGLSDRVSLHFGINTEEVQRTTFKADSLDIGAAYLLPISWAQAAASVSLAPSLRGATTAAQAKLGVLKNADRYLFLGVVGTGNTTFNGDPLPLRLDLSAGWRTGLTGLLLPTFTYLRSGEQRVGLLVGGTVGDHIFMGLRPSWGITRTAPDFELDIQLHIPFGRASIGAWGLQ